MPRVQNRGIELKKGGKMLKKIAKGLKIVACGCLGGSMPFWTLSQDWDEENLFSVLLNWGRYILSVTGVGLFLLGIPWTPGVASGSAMIIDSKDIMIIVFYYGLAVGVPLGIALILDVLALVFWLISIPFDVFSWFVEKTKKSKSKRIYQRCNVDSRVSGILRLSTKDLKYIKKHPEVMDWQVLEELRKGIIKLSLPDDAASAEKLLDKFTKDGKKCVEPYIYRSGGYPYTGERFVKCNLHRCADSRCPYYRALKDIKRRKAETEEKRERLVANKNAAVEKVYGNKYMAHMGR